jgi:hypothetical protein
LSHWGILIIATPKQTELAGCEAVYAVTEQNRSFLPGDQLIGAIAIGTHPSLAPTAAHRTFNA